MDVITTAIISALAGLSKDAVKDSYNAFKAALKEKFGAKSELVEALDKLEKTPEREDRQATVKAELEIAKVKDDPEMLKLAQELLKKLKEQPGGQQIINQTQGTNLSRKKSSGQRIGFCALEKFRARSMRDLFSLYVGTPNSN